MNPDPIALDTLSCDWQARPKGAPSFDDLAGAVRRVERAPDALRVTYAPESAADLRALVAAERLCCQEIGWELAGDTPTLTIRATAPQLAIFEEMFRQPPVRG